MRRLFIFEQEQSLVAEKLGATDMVDRLDHARGAL
jgi:hypothetical protein